MSKIAMEAVIIAAVDPIFRHLQDLQSEITALIGQLVECESPSDDPAAVNRFVELIADTCAPFARVKTFAGGSFGRHLTAEVQLPGRRKKGQVLVLGHSDTVWPLGTLRSMPFREEKGRLWGPGVLDMKSGRFAHRNDGMDFESYKKLVGYDKWESIDERFAPKQ